MKKFILNFVTIIVCFSCGERNNSRTVETNHVDSSSYIGNQVEASTANNLKKVTSKNALQLLSDWKLTPEEFSKMKNHYAACRGNTAYCNVREFSIYFTAFDLIRDLYPPSAWNYVFVPARYKDNIDEDRYKRTRKRKNPAHGNVKGYATMLLMISPNAPSVLVEPVYFDICIICPPPDTGTCDLSSPVSALKK